MWHVPETILVNNSTFFYRTPCTIQLFCLSPAKRKTCTYTCKEDATLEVFSVTQILAAISNVSMSYKTVHPGKRAKGRHWRTRRESLSRHELREKDGKEAFFGKIFCQTPESPLSPLNKGWNYHLLPLRRVFGEANLVAAQEFSTVKEAERAGAWFQS